MAEKVSEYRQWLVSVQPQIGRRVHNTGHEWSAKGSRGFPQQRA